MELKGKTALITGASGKIGAALALALAAEGVHLGLQYNQSFAKVESLCKEIKSFKVSCEPLKASLNNAEDSKELIQNHLAKLGKLDILINCIGDFSFKPLSDLSPVQFRENINSNLNTAFDLSYFALPAMRKQNEGRVLQFGYATANQIEGKPNILPYHISKMGLILLVKSLAKQEAGNNILVNCLSPGIVDSSEYFPKTEIPLARPAKLSEIYEAALFLLKSDYITGANLEIDGGWRGSFS